MRFVWSLILVLVLVTAVVVVGGRVRAGNGSSPDVARSGPVARQTPAAVTRPPATPGRTPDPAPAKPEPRDPEPAKPSPAQPNPVTPGPVTPEPAAAQPVTADPAPVDPAAGDPPPDPDDTPANGAPDDTPDDATPAEPAGGSLTNDGATHTTTNDPTADPTDVPTALPDAPAVAKAPDDPTAAAPGPDGEAEALANELISSSDERRSEDDETTDDALGGGTTSGPNDAAEAKLVRQEDGSLLVDDRFIIRGAGTKADPYRITWEMLVSANETYRPRLGKTELPARITMLDGKWVKITGFLAFPLASTSIEEALVMLNQWDGCCIGVPPSPYDALETRLSAPLKFDKGHVFQYGTATGVLKIDPYLVNNWLVGLYLLEDAKIEMDL